MMTPPLREARQLAEGLRFSLDLSTGSSAEDPSVVRKARSLFAQQDLEINRSLTPELAEQLEQAYEVLGIPTGTVQSFVFASPELHAECLASTRAECLIRFSSTLIDLLNDAELRFVAGHEVGHFLLGHHATGPATVARSVEHYMSLRYQEISADRVGLIACGSLDDAIRALMKSSSGLSDRHLRFDVSAFLSQLRHVDDGPLLSGLQSTHPALVIRARALLWLSMSDAYAHIGNVGAHGELENLDRRVEADLERYVDSSARSLIAEARETVLLWTVADHVVREGAFRRPHQEAVERVLSRELLDGLRGFLHGMDTGTAQAEVSKRLGNATDELRSLIPGAFSSEVSQIRKLVAAELGEKGGESSASQ